MNYGIVPAQLGVVTSGASAVAEKYAAQFMSSMISSNFANAPKGVDSMVCVNAADHMAKVMPTPQVSPQPTSAPEIATRMPLLSKFVPSNINQTFSSNNSSSREQAGFFRRQYENFQRFQERFKQFEQTHKEKIDFAKEGMRTGGAFYSMDQYVDKKKAQWTAEDLGDQKGSSQDWGPEIDAASAFAFYSIGGETGKAAIAGVAKKIGGNKDWVTAASVAVVEGTKQLAKGGDVKTLVTNAASVAAGKVVKPLGYLQSFKIYQAKHLAKHVLEATDGTFDSLKVKPAEIINNSRLVFEQAKADYKKAVDVGEVGTMRNAQDKMVENINECTIMAGMIEHLSNKNSGESQLIDTLNDMKRSRDELLSMCEGLTPLINQDNSHGVISSFGDEQSVQNSNIANTPPSRLMQATTSSRPGVNIAAETSKNENNKTAAAAKVMQAPSNLTPAPESKSGKKASIGFPSKT